MPKQYTSLSEYYINTYGEKVYKLSIDGGFTCPNRDGLIDTKGCIFCSKGGSGDFAATGHNSVHEAIREAKGRIQKKTNAQKFVVYFQAFTNTYDEPERLKTLYESVLFDSNNERDESIVGISIATRPDCLAGDVLMVLDDLNTKTDVYVELGLQTIHKKSADFIRRGYSLDIYDKAVKELTKRHIKVVTHLIIGLPNESPDDIKASVQYVCKQPIQGIKLQLLHILKGTDLSNYYLSHPFHVYELDEYVKLIVELIHLIPKDIVIHRMTGDGPKALLIAPLWSANKRQVLNAIAKELRKESL